MVLVTNEDEQEQEERILSACKNAHQRIMVEKNAHQRIMVVALLPYVCHWVPLLEPKHAIIIKHSMQQVYII